MLVRAREQHSWVSTALYSTANHLASLQGSSDQTHHYSEVAVLFPVLEERCVLHLVLLPQQV